MLQIHWKMRVNWVELLYERRKIMSDEKLNMYMEQALKIMAEGYT